MISTHSDLNQFFTARPGASARRPGTTDDGRAAGIAVAMQPGKATKSVSRVSRTRPCPAEPTPVSLVPVLNDLLRARAATLG